MTLEGKAFENIVGKEERNLNRAWLEKVKMLLTLFPHCFLHSFNPLPYDKFFD